MRSRILSAVLLSIGCSQVLASGIVGFGPANAFPVAVAPTTVAIGDVTGDGRNDVVFASRETLVVAVQDASGRLSSYQIYPYSDTFNGGYVKVLDLDGQNGLDVVVGNDDGTWSFVALPSGLLAEPELAAGPSVFVQEAIDLFGNGKKDLLAFVHNAGQAAGSFRYINDGIGGLTSGAAWSGPLERGLRLGQGDIDHDGLNDVVASGIASQDIFLFRNNGDGHLSFVSKLAGGCGTSGIDEVVAGDINHDGRVDIITATPLGPSATCLQAFLGKGGWEFEEPLRLASHAEVREVVIADVNLDGRNDVVALYAGEGLLGIYMQRHDGTLSSETLHAIPPQHRWIDGIAIGDFSGDGCPDIALAGFHNLVTLEGLRCGDWLFLDDFERASSSDRPRR